MLELTTISRDALAGYDRIIIERGKVRVGNVRCRFMGEKVVVYSIQVFPEFQGNGYGSAAINLLKKRYPVIVADRVRFTAQGFWRKMNFQELPNGNWECRQDQ